MKKVLYGLGSLSYSVISQTVGNFFMFFATSVLGIKGTLVGIAIAISTIWDGISDTIVGYLSDNYPLGKLGKRNGYMLFATIGMAIFNVLLWCVPNGISNALKFVWILLSLLLLETFNTCFSTPFMALGNELSSSYDDRTKVNAWSTVFFLIGIIIPSILLVIFLPNTPDYPIGQLNPNGYVKISITTSAICLIFGLICTFSTLKTTRNMQNIAKVNKGKQKNLKSKNITKENSSNKSNDTKIHESNVSNVDNEINPYRKIKNKKFKFRDLYKNFLLAFKNKKLFKLILGYVFTSMSTIFLCSVGLHFFTYSFFYTSNQITILLLFLMLGTISSQPLWVFISKKKMKKPALITGILLTISAVFCVILIYLFRIDLYKISFYLMLLAVFICGVGSGALYSLPSSMYGDAIMNISKDGSKVATYSGTLTFASNISNSITQLLVGILLDIIHFDSSLEVQTLGVQTGLALILFIGVQASLIIACAIFSSYKEKKIENLVSNIHK